MATLPAVPEALRLYDADVWPGVEAWRDARRDWESRNGVTVPEVWAAMLAEARRRGAYNHPYLTDRFVDSEDADPRLHVGEAQ